jgi:hypothetical protein
VFLQGTVPEVFFMELYGNFPLQCDLVCTGYLSKIPQTVCLKHRQLFSYSSEGWEVQDQDSVRVWFLVRILFLACIWLLWSHMAFPLSKCRESKL